jgi:cell division protein FtsZ
MQLGGGALMSIGQGQGLHKAQQAIEQALHHPLLESVCLDNARGMIVNFTGGSDMTLLEVGDALMHLQNQAGKQTEVIMGINNNEQMQGRAQVILIVTGLGGTPIEEIMPNIEQKQISPVDESVSLIMILPLDCWMKFQIPSRWCLLALQQI